MSKTSLISRLKLRLQPATRLAARVIKGVVKALIFLTLIVCAIWAGLLLWIQLVDYPVMRWLVVAVGAVFSLITLINYIRHSKQGAKWLAGFSVLWVLLAMWFAWLPAKQDRPWQPEVSRYLSISQDEQNPNLVTLHNVRDFDWVRAPDSETLVQPTEPYYYKVAAETAKEKGERIDLVAKERWVDRTVDLSKLSGVDIINSYWMGAPIGHTLLSFRFEDDRPLSFSIEIRKEEDEVFSAIGGFFKQFEMIVVAAEERDIVYTRSNVRGEQVYLFPVQGMTQQQIQELFLQYLNQAEQLQQEAKWYNTLIRNCTTVLFDMARDVTKGDGLFPRDYRILASGYVPNYLYDEGLLPAGNWDIKQWYKRAHINPKVASFSEADNQSAYDYSQKIREGLPIPKPSISNNPES